MQLMVAASTPLHCSHAPPLPILAFFFFFFFTALSVSHLQVQDNDNDNDDAMWLLSFKASSIYTDPSSLLLLRSWNASTHPCTTPWFGVSCDPLSSRVISLNLTHQPPNAPGSTPTTRLSLSGTLSPSLANLTHLRTLSLAYNAFSGPVPPELGNLKSLQILELQGCNFSGPIPDSLSNLSSLRLLNLSHNSLSGSIPYGLIGYGSLSVLDLSNNLLSGDFAVASSSGCHVLTYLSLSNNFLVDDIPADIGSCSNLTTLLLDGNILQGKIPPEIGRISQLRVLDVSRNSLTDRIPPELANCRMLSVLVLTNLFDSSFDAASSYHDGSSNPGVAVGIDFASFRGEFNAFDGDLPSEVLLLPNLQMLWAPRANLGGRLPSNWTASCSLRVLNLGLNIITGSVPQSLGLCTNLTYLDLSSNGLQGYLPENLQIPCMVYFNVSHNSLSGAIQDFGDSRCGLRVKSKSSCGEDLVGLLDLDEVEEDFQIAYSLINPCRGGSHTTDISVVAHDFSWNSFAGPPPVFSLSLAAPIRVSYWLFLNNNNFKTSRLSELVSGCENLQNFYLNLSANQIYGGIDAKFFNCPSLVYFEAAQNLINGSILAEVGSLKMLQYLDLSRNNLSGFLPEKLGELKGLEQILLAENNLSGEIPAQLGELTSLVALNLSHNDLRGYIPATLGNATKLEILLLDHNGICGDIPASLAALSNLTQLDLSFNNLSGHVPHFQQAINCDDFRGNRYLQSCPDQYGSAPPAWVPVPPEVRKGHNGNKLRSFVVGISTSLTILFSVLVVIVCLFLGRRKLSRLTSLRRKVVVTFADAPAGLNYDNVVRATGNFSMGNLIGTGGFGSTYKAELVPGFLVAVKRLSIGRFQGIQQFDAEIRTLGRIRHKHLVTLIGYHVGEAEMFLVYNYLPGGNLETFIHERSSMNKQWRVIHKIAVDIARALTFLHYSCVPRIVHRDIKPSNILLDEELNAYLSDFGLARLLEVFETHATTDVAGTFGYVAPEYATTCRVSDKADVYSFGVVLLELMSGKKSLDPSFSEYGNGFNIVSWARLVVSEGRPSELFSNELWESSPQDDLLAILRLASSCTVESLSVRPSMKQVLENLKTLNL